MDNEQTTKILIAIQKLSTQQDNMLDDITDMRSEMKVTHKELFTEIKRVDDKYSNRIIGALGAAIISLGGMVWSLLK